MNTENQNSSVPTSRDFGDPHPFYHKLRREEPVKRIDGLGGYLLTRYEDCVAVLKNTEHFTADRLHRLIQSQFPFANESVAPLLFELYSISMLVKDPPDHARIRGYVNRGFTPRALEIYHERVSGAVEELLDRAEETGCAEKPFDMQRDFASVLPSLIISEIMGAPPSDREQIQSWGADISLNGSTRGGRELLAHSESSMREFVAYVEDLIAERKNSPREDMISYMIAGAQSGRINDREMTHQVIQLIVGGQMTTLDMIGCGIQAFLENPEQIARLRENPDWIDGAAEEVLRFTSPSQMAHRLVKKEIEIGGVLLRPGDLVFTVIAAANRDPAVFPEPDRFDITRENAKKNIAFGAGAHYCIGGNLARLEGRLAFQKLFARFPGLRAAGPPVWRRDGLYFRGLDSLPVVWD